jgi:2-oxoglutarate dehydrogenase E1 component
MSDISAFHGPNAGYVLELYERYQHDPASVDAQTRAFFEHWTPPSPAPAQATPDGGSVPSPLDVTHTVSAARLIRYIRELGHLDARIDPLGSDPPSDPGLQLATHNVTESDLARLPASIVRGPLVEGSRDALEAVTRLRAVYCGSTGYETDHTRYSRSATGFGRRSRANASSISTPTASASCLSG